MRRKNNISYIISELTRFYSMNNSEFASFIGIAPTTLSSWISRNSIDYDLIYAKCEDIDANWLLTGEGEMLKKNDEKVLHLAEPIAEYEKEDDNNLVGIIVSQQRTIEKLCDMLMEKKTISNAPGEDAGCAAVSGSLG